MDYSDGENHEPETQDSGITKIPITRYGKNRKQGSENGNAHTPTRQTCRICQGDDLVSSHIIRARSEAVEAVVLLQKHALCNLFQEERTTAAWVKTGEEAKRPSKTRNESIGVGTGRFRLKMIQPVDSSSLDIRPQQPPCIALKIVLYDVAPYTLKQERLVEDGAKANAMKGYYSGSCLGQTYWLNSSRRRPERRLVGYHNGHNRTQLGYRSLRSWVLGVDWKGAFVLSRAETEATVAKVLLEVTARLPEVLLAHPKLADVLVLGEAFLISKSLLFPGRLLIEGADFSLSEGNGHNRPPETNALDPIIASARETMTKLEADIEDQEGVDDRKVFKNDTDGGWRMSYALASSQSPFVKPNLPFLDKITWTLIFQAVMDTVGRTTRIWRTIPGTIRALSPAHDAATSVRIEVIFPSV
ncbi:hypothetical protein BKA70DRAFT_1237679 [Coprinopsis sp. MPI-PUGE-AT-0042]|nr:hypothetical protein BKA70DRAFT_1237679 [Coprinopsis sp. MPI-PUGE-AT-0042]